MELITGIAVGFSRHCYNTLLTCVVGKLGTCTMIELMEIDRDSSIFGFEARCQKFVESSLKPQCPLLAGWFPLVICILPCRPGRSVWGTSAFKGSILDDKKWFPIIMSKSLSQMITVQKRSLPSLARYYIMLRFLKRASGLWWLPSDAKDYASRGANSMLHTPNTTRRHSVNSL